VGSSLFYKQTDIFQRSTKTRPHNYIDDQWSSLQRRALVKSGQLVLAGAHRYEAVSLGGR
jgi:hypothetical protein